MTYIVDCDTAGKVLQCLDEDVYTWADGGYGNKNLITFEICESDYMEYSSGANYKILDDSKFKADVTRGYQTAVELCADICKRHGWNPADKLPSGLYLISSHYEGNVAGLSTSHVDPTHIWNKMGWTMDKFRSDVKAAMAGATVAQDATEPIYRVRKTWTDVSSQLFAGTLEGAKKACQAGYSVYDEDGKCVYTVESKGFQAADLKGLTESEKIAKIAPLYQDCMRNTGMLASVGLAQFCLESGYGTTDLAEFANNLHGMKCSLSGNTWSGSAWDGSSKYGKYSAEVYSGVTQQVYSEFRKYDCCEDSIADRAAYFIGAKNGTDLRYPGISKITDYKEQITLIKAGGYATDPDYVTKLYNIVEKWDLFDYDDGIETPTDEQGNILPDVDEPWYRVGTGWENGKCQNQIGAYHDVEKAKKCADSARDSSKADYYVFDESGTAIYTASYTPPAQHTVQAGIFTDSANANKLVAKLKAAGFDAIVKIEDGQNKVQVGVFEKKANAEALVEKLKKAGFDAIVK